MGENAMWEAWRITNGEPPVRLEPRHIARDDAKKVAEEDLRKRRPSAALVQLEWRDDSDVSVLEVTREERYEVRIVMMYSPRQQAIGVKRATPSPRQRR